jgi:hypothetical protein
VKRLVVLLALSSTAFAGYEAARPISIDHTQTGGSDTSNFTTLFSGTYGYLATVPNSGKIRNTVACGLSLITCPADLIFTSDSACAVPLSWEVESYSAATGSIVAWVKVPNVSHALDTTFYECYGNADVTTFQGGSRGAAWDGNFKLIQHLGSATALQALDATANANSTTVNNAAPITGVVRGGVHFTGAPASNFSVASSTALDSNTGTWEAWINTSQPVTGGAYVLLFARASSQRGITLFLETSIGQTASAGAGAQSGSRHGRRACAERWLLAPHCVHLRRRGRSGVVCGWVRRGQ